MTEPASAPLDPSPPVRTKPEGFFWGGFAAGFLTGLIGLLVCYFGTKPATKSGAGYGFLSRLVLTFGAVFVMIVFDDPHGRARASSTAWTEHRWAGYSAELPGNAVLQDFTIRETVLGTMVVHAAEVGDFGHAYFDITPGEEPSAFADIAADLFRGSVIEAETANARGNPGSLLLVRLDDQSGYCRVRFVSVGQRLIYLWGCTVERDSQSARRVVGSLRLDD
jgi:hypothetical protein